MPIATRNLKTPVGLIRAGTAGAQQQPSPAQAELLARADPAPVPTTTAQRLPTTAGPPPLLALAGLKSLRGGLGLTIRRRLLDRSS